MKVKTFVFAVVAGSFHNFFLDFHIRYGLQLCFYLFIVQKTYDFFSNVKFLQLNSVLSNFLRFFVNLRELKEV